MQSYLDRPAALNDILKLALREPIVRIKPILGPNGERLWLKRIEALSLWLRLQKGGRRRAFAAELRGLHVLAKAGLPVPEVVSEGPDHMVLSDVGATLNVLLHRPDLTAGKRAAAFRAAGAALGRLHRAGFVHGRPTVRNICWNGEEVHFIDLERFSEAQATSRRKALDVALFVHSYLRETGAVGPDLESALKAYRTAAPLGCWADVQALGARLHRFVPLIAPLRWVRPGAAALQSLPEAVAYICRPVV